MSSRRPPRSAKSSKGKTGRILVIGAGVLLFVGVAAVIGAKLWVESYLRSPEFRAFVARKTSQTIHAEGQFAPFYLSGLNFFCDQFKAQGLPEAAFAGLDVQQMRAEVSTRRFFDGVWQIDDVTIQRLQVSLDGPRLLAAPESDSPGTVPAGTSGPIPPGVSGADAPKPSKPETSSGWLPNRVEISGANVRELNVTWGQPGQSGSLSGTQVQASPRDQSAWNITAHGGRLVYPGFPAFTLKNAQVLYRKPSAFIQAAELELERPGQMESAPLGGMGSVRATGEIVPGDMADVHLDLAGLDLTPFLWEDWRMRLHGNLTGGIDVRGSIAPGKTPKASGKIQLNKGQIEGLPVLDNIAALTKLQQYKKLNLSKASADFTHEAGKLAVRNLVLEATGLVRVEGAFTVVDGIIDGNFQVGVTPASLQWLPGSQETVFKENRDGYIWAPMHLSGPAKSPKEDLSPRLEAAVAGAVIEKGMETLKSGKKATEDVIKGALDLLLK